MSGYVSDFISEEHPSIIPYYYSNEHEFEVVAKSKV